MGREGIQDAREARDVRVDAAAGGADSGAKLWRWLACRSSTLHHEKEFSSKCRQEMTWQVTNTCAGCCNTACTAPRARIDTH